MKEKCKKKQQKNKKKQKKQEKNKQRQKGARGTEAIAKGSGLNDFAVHL